jgi:hypothetical protein
MARNWGSTTPCLEEGWGDRSGVAKEEKIAGAGCWIFPANFEDGFWRLEGRRLGFAL